MKEKSFLKRYRMVLIIGMIYIIIFIVNNNKFKSNISFSINDFVQMVGMLPPTFTLVSLLDVWMERETMVKLIGKDSGIKGNLIALLMGTIGVGPLYMTFPIMHLFIKKGAEIRNLFIFMGAWSTTKITQIFFEINSLGLKYTLLRLTLNIISIYFISLILERVIKKEKNWAIKVH